MWRSKLQTEVVKALKAGDSERVEVIRYLISLIDKKAMTVEVGKMTEADEMGVLWKEMKNKQEVREMFAKAGRQELAHKSDREIKILAEFLPKEAAEEEIETLVRKVVGENAGANFGMVMGKVTKELAGRADGQRIAMVVKKVLG